MPDSSWKVSDELWSRVFRTLLMQAKAKGVPWTWETREFIMHQTDVVASLEAGLHFYSFKLAPKLE